MSSEIDSHTRFAQDWDELAIADVRKVEESGHDKVVLSTYPKASIFRSRRSCTTIGMADPPHVRRPLTPPSIRANPIPTRKPFLTSAGPFSLRIRP